MKQPSRRQLAVLLVLAFLLRLAAGWVWQSRLDDKFGMGDSESYWNLGKAIAQGQPVKVADLAQLNEARSDALAHSQLIPSSTGPAGFVLDLTNKKSLHRMLWPLALSAAELLTSARPGQIRQCAGQGCDWLFLDTSRNHLRKWCSMDECGNRSKSRRFFERSRKLESTR